MSDKKTTSDWKKMVLGKAGTRGMGNPMNKVATKKALNPFRGKKGHWSDEPPPPQRDINGKIITKKGMFDTSDWFWV